MRLFYVGEGIEEAADRAVNLAIALIVAVAFVGLFMVDGRVPLQFSFSNEGWVSFVPKVVAAIVYPLGAFLVSTLRYSSLPPVRWLARVVVFLIVVVGILAFNHAL